MNILVILIEMAVFAAIFTAVIFSYFRGGRKYSPASIHNYPPDIQTLRKACFSTPLIKSA